MAKRLDTYRPTAKCQKRFTNGRLIASPTGARGSIIGFRRNIKTICLPFQVVVRDILPYLLVIIVTTNDMIVVTSLPDGEASRL